MKKDLAELRATADWLDTLGVHVAADRIRSCADELAAALAEQGWRSMDSAPKSTLDEHGRVRGVFLLGFCPDEAVDPASCLSVIWWEPLTDGGVWYGQEAMTVRPTHWMPLPPPPPGGGS